MVLFSFLQDWGPQGMYLLLISWHNALGLLIVLDFEKESKHDISYWQA